jgi:hypothetical protein
MEEEKKGKSEISIRAERMANEIWEKASGVNTDWYADLVLRLEKSMKRAQEKRDFERWSTFCNREF